MANIGSWNITPMEYDFHDGESNTDLAYFSPKDLGNRLHEAMEETFGKSANNKFNNKIFEYRTTNIRTNNTQATFKIKPHDLDKNCLTFIIWSQKERSGEPGGKIDMGKKQIGELIKALMEYYNSIGDSK